MDDRPPREPASAGSGTPMHEPESAGDITASPSRSAMQRRRPHAVVEPGAAVPPRPARSLLARALRLALWAVILLFAGAVALIAGFRFVDPPATAFTLAHSLSGGRVDQQWVTLARMSPHLVRAVIASEDAKFCSHRGIDIGEIEAAIERARGGIPRGASTISMQVIKNLFLWKGKSYLRKAIEVPLTIVMELMWPKSRILEVYLNIAEWGPGVYGAEAAARFHFAKPAARLNEREAALLAVALPNPALRDAGDPGPGTQRLAARIEARVRALGRSTLCVEPAMSR
jgi:monofunctional biosynthetic peptidoglycan transglycosylase